jgi:hypothetical protein
MPGLWKHTQSKLIERDTVNHRYFETFGRNPFVIPETLS